MRWAVIAGVIIIGCGYYYRSAGSHEEVNKARDHLVDGNPIEVEKMVTPTRVITRSTFSEEYALVPGSIENDLETVLNLITDCQQIIRNFDSFFLPDNEAVSSFLRGNNPEKIAWIPPDHFAISSEGELLDRNGVPLFFHRISGFQFQIRSAGEDKVMWTQDDVNYPDPRFLKE